MEQILYPVDYITNPRITSHVQLRGSAPAVWTQNLDLSYRPKMKVESIDKPEIWEASKKHLDDLKDMYIGVGERYMYK